MTINALPICLSGFHEPKTNVGFVLVGGIGRGCLLAIGEKNPCESSDHPHKIDSRNKPSEIVIVLIDNNQAANLRREVDLLTTT